MSETTHTPTTPEAALAAQFKAIRTTAGMAAFLMEAGIMRADRSMIDSALEHLETIKTDTEFAKLNAVSIMSRRADEDGFQSHQGVGKGDAGLSPSAECESEKTSDAAPAAVRLEIVAANIDGVWKLSDTLRKLPGVHRGRGFTISKIWGNAEICEIRGPVS